MVKPSSLQAFAHRSALARSKCGFENRIKNTFSIRSVSAYRKLLIHAPQQQCFVVTIVQHRTSVLDKTACMCSKTSRVDNTKSVHNRSKPAVFVRTAQGLSSNQNEVATNSKSDLWRTALFANTCRKAKGPRGTILVTQTRKSQSTELFTRSLGWVTKTGTRGERSRPNHRKEMVATI